MDSDHLGVRPCVLRSDSSEEVRAEGLPNKEIGMAKPIPETISLIEAAHHLGVLEEEVIDLAEDGLVQALKVDGELVVTWESLQEFLADFGGFDQ